jgi:hypothetical protein
MVDLDPKVRRWHRDYISNTGRACADLVPQ